MLKTTLINPDGELVEVKNVAKLCRENGLSVYQMHCVINKQHPEHRGWKLPLEGETKEYTVIEKMAFNLKKKERRAKLLARMMYESKPTGETFNGG